MTQTSRRLVLLLLTLPLLVSAAAGIQEPKRQFTLDAKKFKFSPGRLEVEEGDVVRITLIAGDIPHSFTIDDYRIAKRGEPGKPLTFDFLADHSGTFKFYCNLTIDDGCKKMSGELIVKKK